MSDRQRKGDQKPSGDPPTETPACRAYSRWLGKGTVRVAWLALLLAVLAPPTGLGIRLCWMRSTGIPCPGCGLSRSLSCAAHGMFLESWLYHPFGPLLLVFFVAVALISLAPANLRARWQAALKARPGLLNAAFVGFAVAFVGFGLLRALLQLGGFCQFNV